ncbi:transcription initiation factor TFIID subunit 11 [Nematocida displodere]|uniref:Transcription initiation factor TFIID subunit 11 n=1 Tax=Nematocida displodere TaxID=1805483 RepID=A0A177EBZ5_9MICR|nr:transcription initiation factor TFIID subunit 11 [Nematocida displodere]
MRADEGDPRDTESEEIEEEEYQEIRPEQETSALTEDELLRYGTFRHTGFNKGGIRKFVSQVLGHTCNPNFAIVLAGIAKVFVSELVEEAKDVQSEWKDGGELLPSHIHEAYRRLYHRMPNMSCPR